ncbi:MAG: GvpL/GvpF family gas vesicle protein [Ignavibacteriales bacterium]|nr:GvpL/GvpF family gas vesicle protein [Ignavibacteriales bacterium]
MKEDTQKQLSDKILEKLADKIKLNQQLRQKLEPFADLPVEKVVDAILNQFNYLLSGELRDLTIKMIENEVESEKEIIIENIPIYEKTVDEIPPTETPKIEEKLPEPVASEVTTESIMERYGTKEHFPTESLDIEFKDSDWFYLLGFCYAPDSTGHGIPTKKLELKGVDGTNNIILLDYGDVRFFIHQLQPSAYPKDNAGRLSLSTKSSVQLKYEYEKTLNILRSEEVLVAFPFWTVIQNKDTITKQIEDKYVDILRSLIDVHDAVDWDVEVFAFDQHLIELPMIAASGKDRTSTRESRHPVSKGRDVKMLEKLLFKEKSLAQEIHSQLLLHATKSKIDFMIRLDNAFMDDWKSILSSRYTVGKDKRKNFFKSIRSIQHEYEQFKLMLRVTSPNVRISF